MHVILEHQPTAFSTKDGFKLSLKRHGSITQVERSMQSPCISSHLALIDRISRCTWYRNGSSLLQAVLSTLQTHNNTYQHVPICFLRV